jgi:Acetyltransferase (isoleucine patch superfamily)
MSSKALVESVPVGEPGPGAVPSKLRRVRVRRDTLPQRIWARLWIPFAGTSPLGRLATRLALLGAPPYRGRAYLASKCPRGLVCPSAKLHSDDIRLGANIFIGDDVVIFQNYGGGLFALGDRSNIHLGTIIETGAGGTVTIGEDSHIQPRCQLSAYYKSIHIGSSVNIAVGCAFFPYDHGIERGIPIGVQPLVSKGDIVIEDDVWLGTGVTVLAGVRIGQGAVVGAGAVVTRDIPENSIAAGIPARVIGQRQ